MIQSLISRRHHNQVIYNNHIISCFCRTSASCFKCCGPGCPAGAYSGARMFAWEERLQLSSAQEAELVLYTGVCPVTRPQTPQYWTYDESF